MPIEPDDLPDFDSLPRAKQRGAIRWMLEEIDRIDASIDRAHREIDRIGEVTQRKLDRLNANR